MSKIDVEGFLSKLQRYDPEMDSSEVFQGMVPDNGGDYVDVDELRKALESLNEQLNN